MKSKAVLAIAATISLFCAAADAADWKVFVGGAMTRIPSNRRRFRQGERQQTRLRVRTTGALQKRLAAGDKADIVVVTAPQEGGRRSEPLSLS